MPSLSAPERRSSSRNSNRAPSRSSVFRGSPTPKSKDNLPQELLLALEDEESPPSSPVVRRGGRSSPKLSPGLAKPSAHRATSSDIPGLACTPSLLGAVLRDDVNVDDYAVLDTGMSFRRSYDLEQVFSFINPAQSDAKLANMSFNLGFTESKDEGFLVAQSEESDEEKKLIEHGTSTKAKGRKKAAGGRGGAKSKAKSKSKSPTRKSARSTTKKTSHRRERSGMSRSDGPSPMDHLAFHIPTLGTATSGLELTPINSFAADCGEGGPLVPLSSQDGMALRVFFSSDNLEGRGGEAAPMVHHT